MFALAFSKKVVYNKDRRNPSSDFQELVLMKGDETPMQKIIRKKVYDTETATPIASAVYGSFGDPEGYEEILYQAPEGHYFLFGRGGEDSPYPTEKITAMSKDRATAWAVDHN